MRPRTDYIVTKDQVQGYAQSWLSAALKWDYEGTKCTTSTLYRVLLIAAARVVSVFAACRDLAAAPSDQTIRNALDANLTDIGELERRLNLALVVELPKATRSRARPLAIDLTLIPYHGQPDRDPKEIYRGQPKSGTTHFHAYATATVLHRGHRYTLALTRVKLGESMVEVVRRLLTNVRRRGVKIKYLLLDKGFYGVAVITHLKRARLAFVIPAVPRGRKPKHSTRATGLRALLRQPHGYYEHTLTSVREGRTSRTTVTICVASKTYTHAKSGRRRRKPLLYAVHGLRMEPRLVRETYRQRFGIETTYRQMNEARIKTTTRDPQQRLLFVGIALVLRNVWVWLHYQLATSKNSTEPRVHLSLLRFGEFLLWITQTIQRLLKADQHQGLDHKTYERVTAYA